jgi:hypothetical protein
MERVHQDDVRLRKNRRLHRHDQGPPFCCPGIHKGDLTVIRKLMRDTLCFLADRGPPHNEVSIKRLRGRLCVPQGHEHRQPGFAGEVHQRRARRRVAAAQLRCSCAIERDVFWTRKMGRSRP